MKYYVKIYLAINTIFFDEEASAVKEAIYKAYDIRVDAIIIQDMGIMAVPAQVLFPTTKIR